MTLHRPFESPIVYDDPDACHFRAADADGSEFLSWWESVHPSERQPWDGHQLVQGERRVYFRPHPDPTLTVEIVETYRGSFTGLRYLHRPEARDYWTALLEQGYRRDVP